jgi:outer membrane protein
MKALLHLVLAAVLMLGGFFTASAQQLRIGTVDMKKVFANYQRTKEEEARINEERHRLKKELDDMMQAYEKATDEVAKLSEDINRPELSPTAKAEKTKLREAKIREVRDKETAIREFQGSNEKKLADETMRVRSNLVDAINVVVIAKVKANQYDLVFDRSGQSLNSVPILLYAKDAYDFTDDVIKALNQSDSPAPRAPPVKPPATGSQKKSK